MDVIRRLSDGWLGATQSVADCFYCACFRATRDIQIPAESWYGVIETSPIRRAASRSADGADLVIAGVVRQLGQPELLEQRW
jgi:hypothetical protein